MKLVPVSLCTLCVLLVSGCTAVENLQSSDANLARQILAENCVVGEYRPNPNSGLIFLREGIENKHVNSPRVHYKKRLTFENITIYSIKELNDGWVEVDASGQRTRENFYFNRDTAEFACTPEEWRAVFNNPTRLKYEKTPLIKTRMDRLN